LGDLGFKKAILLNKLIIGKGMMSIKQKLMELLEMEIKLLIDIKCMKINRKEFKKKLMKECLMTKEEK
jgi:hypothetical protein